MDSNLAALSLKPPPDYDWIKPAAIDPPKRPRPLAIAPKPQAGFPSPAADFVEESIDLNELLVTNAPATFYARMGGESLLGLGIVPGDIVVVDRSVRPTRRRVVMGTFLGDFFIKVFDQVSGRPALCSRHPCMDQYPPLYLDQDENHHFWGTVTGLVRDDVRDL